MSSLEKTCQEYVLNPKKDRINLKELPVDVVVKNVGIAQEPIRKQPVDPIVKPGNFFYHSNIFLCLYY